MVDCSPSALVELAKCIRCVPTGAASAVRTYLLCQWANAGPVINCADQAGIDFIEAAGITDATVQGAVCKLVTDLKAGGFWDRDTVIYPFASNPGATSAQRAVSHSYNLKNPLLYRLTYSASPAPVHSELGMQNDATNNSYADTGFSTLTEYMRMMVYIDSAATVNNGYYFGCVDSGVATWALQQRISPTVGKNVSTSDGQGYPPNGATVPGAHLIQRRDHLHGEYARATDSWWLDNQVGMTPTIPSTMALLARHRPAIYDSFGDCRISGFSIGDTLTEAEKDAYAAIWDTYETALGRGHP